MNGFPPVASSSLSPLFAAAPPLAVSFITRTLNPLISAMLCFGRFRLLTPTAQRPRPACMWSNPLSRLLPPSLRSFLASDLKMLFEKGVSARVGEIGGGRRG